MVRNREEAARIAESTTTNTPNACQLTTRNWLDVPSVGDFDGDGRADAEDGWKSEPTNRKHVGDRNPPRGTPVSYLGGSHDDGHRALSLGNGMIRTTDGHGLGIVATRPLNWPETEWGLKYVGWSETCDGVLIPIPPQVNTLVSQFVHQGPKYDLKLLDRAVVNGRTGIVKDVRDHIIHQVHRLPQHEQNTRISHFLNAFNTHHYLRLGLLNAAIKDGRTGIVKDVRARIMREIYKLPPS